MASLVCLLEFKLRQTLDGAKRVRLKRGDSVLLIQPGALFPDRLTQKVYANAGTELARMAAD